MIYFSLWVGSLFAMHGPPYLMTLAAPLTVWFAWNFVFWYQKAVQISFQPELDRWVSDTRSSGTNFRRWRHLGKALPEAAKHGGRLLGVAKSDFIFAHASGMFSFAGMMGLIAALVIYSGCLKVAEIARDQVGRDDPDDTSGVLFFQAF